jgi:hypothetical protein
LRVADVYRLFAFNTAGDEELVGKVQKAVEQGLDQSLADHFVIDRKPNEAAVPVL